MTPTRALWLTIVSASAFTLFGGTVGFGLGRFVPNYYRTIASAGGDPGFDPLAFGIGQGVTQGFVAGTAIGMVLVVILGWLDTRSTGQLSDQTREER